MEESMKGLKRTVIADLAERRRWQGSNRLRQVAVAADLHDRTGIVQLPRCTDVYTRCRKPNLLSRPRQ
jgi:transposase